MNLKKSKESIKNKEEELRKLSQKLKDERVKSSELERSNTALANELKDVKRQLEDETQKHQELLDRAESLEAQLAEASKLAEAEAGLAHTKSAEASKVNAPNPLAPTEIPQPMEVIQPLQAPEPAELAGLNPFDNSSMESNPFEEASRS